MINSLVAQMVKRLPTMQETQVKSLGWEDPWRRKWQPTPVLLLGKSHGRRSLVHGVFTFLQNLSHVVTETDSQAVWGTSFLGVPSRFGVGNRGCL